MVQTTRSKPLNKGRRDRAVEFHSDKLSRTYPLTTTGMKNYADDLDERFDITGEKAAVARKLRERLHPGDNPQVTITAGGVRDTLRILGEGPSPPLMFASSETGGVYPYGASGFRRYAADAYEWFEVSKAKLARAAESELRPVRGYAAGVEVGDFYDTLEVLY